MTALLFTNKLDDFTQQMGMATAILHRQVQNFTMATTFWTQNCRAKRMLLLEPFELIPVILGSAINWRLQEKTIKRIWYAKQKFPSAPSHR